AAFLLEMDKRLTAAGVIALPMTRRDIADYLGLTLETVSRALSHLHELSILGFIGKNQRQIVLLDRRQLANLDLQG
ncbi:MAG TPA: helix-turn-helix domain-containing protein, partial [Rhodopila sp.]|nr:helix-turn-helix domain-containing protein [Rhodopila sp.]